MKLEVCWKKVGFKYSAVRRESSQLETVCVNNIEKQFQQNLNKINRPSGVSSLNVNNYCC